MDSLRFGFVNVDRDLTMSAWVDGFLAVELACQRSISIRMTIR